MSQTYVHSDARNTVLPHLLRYLPSSINQEYFIINPPSPSTLVLTSFPPSITPPHLWSAAVLDLSRPNEVEFWFWSSIEFDTDITTSHFAEAYSLLQSNLTFIANLHPTKQHINVGSLHSSFIPHIPTHLLQRLSQPYAKLIFTPENVPPASEIHDKSYEWRRVMEKDLEDVVSTATVKRATTTFGKLSSTGAYPRHSEGEGRPHAWCFTIMDGSVGSLHVRPEARGTGLGKAVMRVELMRNFAGNTSRRDGDEDKWERQYISADVAEGNVPSWKVCEALGARWWRGLKCVWLGIYLESFRSSGTMID